MRLNLAYRPFYDKNGIDETHYSQEAHGRYEKLALFKQLRKEGCSEATAFKVLKISRASYYRWKRCYKRYNLRGLENAPRRPHKVRQPQWKKELEDKIITIRTTYRLWGKNKIKVILERDSGICVSVSTVGRILKKLMQQDIVKPVIFYCGKTHKKRARVFKKHAQRWRYGMKAKQPGELVQIDHMTYTVDVGITIKQFQAICPVTKLLVSQTYSVATSRTARDFLELVKKELPFPLHSIQVDGGSEFMKEFEEACLESKIPLYVLPPRKPRYNGNVERSNWTTKYEFFYQYQGPSKMEFLKTKLQEFVIMYNTFRPHQALQYKTPMQYWTSLGVSYQSHM